MNQQELSDATDPDLKASLAAIKRAAETARKIAVQTDTHIVVVEDGVIERISAEVLRRERQA